MAADKSSLLHLSERLLRPVVRLALRHGLKVQDCYEVLKRVFISEARVELERCAERETVSRLAVMTGLHRRDVARLSEAADEEGEDVTLLTRIIGRWRVDPKFSTRRKPKPLRIEGGSGDFAELVSSSSRDLNPYTVLFELERLGIVRRSGDMVELLRDAFEPAGDTTRGLQLLSSDVQDLVEAVDQNLFNRPDVPNLHIKTEYDSIPSECLPQIRNWFIETGARFHEEARRFLSQFDKDLNPKLYGKEGRSRVMVGSFSRIETHRSETDQKESENDRTK